MGIVQTDTPAPQIRRAQQQDLPQLVQLLAQDKLGATREQYEEPLPECYQQAFAAIAADQNQELLVMSDQQSTILATLQLTFIPNLTYRGGTRAQIEAVRVLHTQRGKGLGKQLIEWAINRAKERGARLVQLTTDKQRPEALHFYENLGFTASHIGMKLHL